MHAISESLQENGKLMLLGVVNFIKLNIITKLLNLHFVVLKGLSYCNTSL